MTARFLKIILFLIVPAFISPENHIIAQEMLFARYDMTNGLPSNFLTDVERDRDGYLWIGTDKGVSIYNANGFRTISSDNGLPGSLVMRLRPHPEGGIMALFYGGGLARISASGAIEKFPAPEDGENRVDFAVASSGVTIINTEKRLYALERDGSITELVRHGLPIRVSSIYPLNTRQMLVQVDSAFYRITTPDTGKPDLERIMLEVKLRRAGKRLHLIAVSGTRILLSDLSGTYFECELPHNELIATNGFTGLLAPTDASFFRGRWFMVSEYYGVQTLDPRVKLSARNVSTISNLEGNMFRDVLVDRDSMLWLAGFGTGLFKLRMEHFETVLNRPALNISSDREGVWIFAEEAVMNIQPETGLRRQWAQPGLTFHSARNTFVQKNGKRWFGSYRYLYDPDLKRDSATSGAKFVIPYGISGMVENAKGKLLLATYGDGIREFNGISSAKPVSGLPTQMIEQVLEISGRNWFTTYGSGMGFIDGDSVFTVNRESGLLSDYVYDLASFNDTLAAALNGGIAYSTNFWEGNWKQVPLPAGDDDKILAVFNRGSQRWAVGNHHLFHWEGDKLRKIAFLPLTFNDREQIVRAVYTPSTDALWLNTTEAVRRFSLGRWLHHEPATALITETVRFSLPSGEKRYPKSGATTFELPFDFTTLEIELALPDFVEESERHFYYAINNGPRVAANGNRIVIQKLAPGTYELNLLAAFSELDDPLAELSVVLSIKPPVWQRAWFVLLLLAIFVIAMYFVVRRFLALRFERRLKTLENEHRLQKERNRIARELHDSVGASLTYIITQLDDIRRRPETAQQDQLQLLGGFSRNAMNQLRETIWAINKESVSAAQLSEKVYAWALSTLSPGIAVKLETEGVLAEVKLTPNQTLNVYRIVQEALQNVLKHAGCSQVSIRFCMKLQSLEIEIVDNGKGFDVNRSGLDESYGLTNMRTRAIEISAVWKIASGPEGTRVRLELPV